MPEPFAGIKEKLDRSREHIDNLQRKIYRFFQDSGYAVLPQDDVQLLLNALQNLEQQEVPLLFSILIGEIVHHLRSCLDHIVWQFSSPAHRASKEARFIEFPILGSKPRDKDRFTRYERKIKGVTHPKVRALIEELQPYKAANPVESRLLILSNLDITDKHRELVLCFSGGGVAIPYDVVNRAEVGYQQGTMTEIEGQHEMQRHAKFVPTITSPDFGQGQPEAVIPALIELHNEVVIIVKRFASFL